MMGERHITLKGLIAGIRSHPTRENEYIHARLREIRLELQRGTKTVKSEGILKLWYLHMMGYEVSFSFFSMVEVMSFVSLTYRRPGFSAAASCFTDDTPATLVTTNLFRKILSGGSPDVSTTCMALSCLSCLGTTEMCRDLQHELMLLMLSSKLPVRRKAILCSHRFVSKYSPSLLAFSPRFKELLNYEDTSVSSCLVTLWLELAQKTPQAFLHLVPGLFKLFSHSLSPWEMLKLIKLFQKLCPCEPRLAPKLQKPLEDVLANPTTQRFVELEVIRLVIEFFPPTLPIVHHVLERLKGSYLDAQDTTLALLSLQLLSCYVHQLDAMATLVQSVFQSHLLFLVLQYVSSPDALVRSSALHIVRHCTTPENFLEICKTLVKLCESSHALCVVDFVLTVLELGKVFRFTLTESMQDYICILAQVALFDLTDVAKNHLLTEIECLIDDLPKLRPFIFRVLCMVLWKFCDGVDVALHKATTRQGEDLDQWTEEFFLRTLVLNSDEKFYPSNNGSCGLTKVQELNQSFGPQEGTWCERLEDHEVKLKIPCGGDKKGNECYSNSVACRAILGVDARVAEKFLLVLGDDAYDRAVADPI